MSELETLQARKGTLETQRSAVRAARTSIENNPVEGLEDNARILKGSLETYAERILTRRIDAAAAEIEALQTSPPEPL